MPKIKSKVVRVRNPVTGDWNDMPAVVSMESIRAAERAANSAEDAESWARGTRSGEAVDSSDPAYHENAKYWKDRAKDEKEGAEAWSKGTKAGEAVSSDDPAYHDNASYWKDQAASQATAAAGSAQTAETWATGGTGGTASATNNAKYYSEQSAASATAAAGSESDAEAWATGGSGGTASATNNAKYFAEKAESWATGGSSGTPSATNNSKYYSEQSAASATSAAQAVLTGNLAPTFSSSTAYKAGDYVIYNGTLYRFTEAHAAGAWTGTDAVAEKIAPVVTDLKNAIDEIAGETVAVDFTTAEVINGIIGSTQKWTYSSTNKQKSYKINITDKGYAKLTVSANSSYSAYIGLLKNDSNLSNQQSPNYCTGITGRIEVTSGNTSEIDIPADCKVITISKSYQTTVDYTPTGASFYGHKAVPDVDASLTVQGDAADAKAVGDALGGVENVLRHKTVESSITLTSGSLYVHNSQTAGQTPVLSSNENGKYTAVDVEWAAGGIVELEMDTVGDNSSTDSMFCDADNKIIYSSLTSANWLTYDSTAQKYTGKKLIPSNAKWMRISVYQGSDTLAYTLTPKALGNMPTSYYVATDGYDDNSGLSLSKAFATFNRALQAGATKILVGGGKYYQAIDLSYAQDSIEIVPAVKDALPVIYGPRSVIATTESAVTGYTKVYAAEYTGTFDDKNIWIFQDDVPDAATEISTAERHSLQRGKATRCGDTKITVCTSSVLENALTEIENASGYKWFYDSTNHILYYSRPEAVSAANPICASFGGSVFVNKKRSMTIKMTGIGVKYQRIDLTDIVAPVLTDCFCVNVRAASAFMWDGNCGAKLYRCEAARVFYTANSGDGFNAHGEKTGDAFAKQSTCFLFDCWAHDNVDDGYSDHERCEITLYGGLYEYNGGGGVTPAVGSHCTAYNVLSRYNTEADFFYTGDPAGSEGGVGGQIACYGCVSVGKGSGRGFRLNGATIEGLFVNCIAINRQYGFYSESNGGTQVGTLINCSTSGCTTPKSANFTVINDDKAVTSVAGKIGAVTLGAGDVAFDGSGTYADGTVGAEVADLKNALYSAVYDEYTLTGWTKGLFSASGEINSGGNGSVSPSNAYIVGTYVYLYDGCRATVAYYSETEYLGKVAANGSINKTSGDWKYFTGEFGTNEYAPVNAKYIRLCVIPTDGTTLTTDNVQTWTNSHCDLYRSLVAQNKEDIADTNERVDVLSATVNPFILTMESGYYVNLTRGVLDSENFAISNKFPATNGFTAKITTHMYGTASIGFFDENDAFISGIDDPDATGSTGLKDYIVTAPDGTAYIRFSCEVSIKNSAKIQPHNFYKNTVDYKNDTDDTYLRQITSADVIDGYLILANGKAAASASWECTDFIDIYPTGNVFLKCFAYGTGGLCFYDTDRQPLLGINGSNIADYGGTNASTAIQKITVTLPSGTRYVRLSNMKSERSITSYNIKYRIKWNANSFDIVSTVKKASGLVDYYTDKKVLVLGDSISSDAYGEYKKWVTDLIDEGKFTLSKVTNSSQHATGFVARYNNQANDFISRMEGIANKDTYDLVVVFGGINDYIQNIPLGGESGETDKTVYFKPAVDYFFQYLINNFTQARICVLLPLRTYNIYPNTAGNKQEVYSEYIHDVAKSYCLPVLNLTEESGFCPFIDTFKAMWTLTPSGYVNPDGVHPTEEYSKQYLAPMIWKFISGLIS